MFGIVKLGFLATVAFVVTGALSFALVAGVAGATSDWGASAAGNAMVALFVAVAVIQAVGVAGVWRGAWRLSRGLVGLGIGAGYTLLGLVTVGWSGLMLMVVFNR